jgi:dihydrolipoamide dehydrogenase
MKFKVNSRLESGVNNKEKGVDVVINGPKGQENLSADVVLLSIGRKPFTDGLSLEKAGLETNKFGKVETSNTW